MDILQKLRRLKGVMLLERRKRPRHIYELGNF
jgi:hypothetical protein